VYPVPTWVHVLAWFLTACAGGLVLACFAVPLVSPPSFEVVYAAFVGAVVFSIAAGYMAHEARKLRGLVILTSDSLVYHAYDGAVTVIPYQDIAGAQDRRYLSRIDVHDADRSRVVPLHHFLPDLPDLIESIAERAEAAGALRDHGQAHPASEDWRANALRRIALIAAPGFLVASVLIFGGVLVIAWTAAFALVGWVVLDRMMESEQPIQRAGDTQQ
jgi:hypothetical protein